MQRVLVVDDLHEVRRGISAALADLDAEVIEAADGIEAMAALSLAPAAGVVTDVRMPRMDGLALLKELRAAKTPVIMHSGYADVGAAVEALRLGAIDFLPAPIDFDRLRRRVEHCLQREDLARETLI